ncbi:MAG: DUF4179 domain-containing protein [Peptostreptococcaceae bacterium]
MNKNKYDEISIPINIDEAIDKGVSKALSEKKKTVNKKNKLPKIAAASLVGILALGVINPSIANGIPIIENIFKDLNETFGLNEIHNEYAQGIGQTQTVNGTTVSIEEAVSDGHNLYLTYKINSERKLPRGEYKPYGEKSGDLMMYNNIKVDNGGTLVGGTSLVGYYKDDYTFVGMESYQIEFKGKESPRNFNVKIKIDNIGDVESNIEQMIKGPFKFYLNIDSKASLDVIEVDEVQSGYKVNNIEMSPYSINVNFAFPKDFVSDRDDILKQVNLYDDKGEIVASQEYDENSITINKTRVEKNTIYDTIFFNYKEMGYDTIPKYIIVKFEDYYQSQEPLDIYTSEDGSTTEYILSDPQKITESKDIKFKIDLKKDSN